MHKASLALALLGTSLPLFAQVNCNTSPPPQTLRTYDPWAASFYYGNLTGNTISLFADISLQSPCTINQMLMTTYDQGSGNPVVPSQLGNVAEVRVYLIPGSRVGNEASPAAWGIDAAGAGTADGMPEAYAELTVVAWNGNSPIQNFKDAGGVATPFLIPAGTYGMCIELIPTTWTGTASLPQTNVPLLNPGALHTIGVSPNPATVWADQFMSLSNDGICQNGWQTVDATGTLIPNATPTGVTDSVNLSIDYTPDPAAGISLAIGEGCYNRPQAFYEQFADGTAQGGDLENTGWQFLPNGAPQSSYIIIPGPGYVTPTGATNLTSGAFTSSSSATWDDACLTQALGFTFPHPGGSTTDITINSNALIYLGLTTDASFSTCGSNYGSTATFQNGPPSGPLGIWAPHNCDLDPDPVAGGGAIYFENPTPNTARITWDAVPNWPAVVGEECSIQITLYDSGQVDIAYGSLWNSAIGSGNTAIVGYSTGDGSALSTLDLSASVGVTTGDGAFPPTLAVDGRPIAGTSVDLVGGDLSPGTAAGFMSIGLGGLAPPGFDLGSFGLPGCSSFLNIPTIVTSVIVFANPQGELRWTWNVPTGFNGTQAFMQMGTITAGYNAAGILVTNAICAKIGT